MKPPPALPRISSTVVSKLGIIKIVKRASRSQLICLMDRSLYRRSRKFRAAYENPEPQIIAIRSVFSCLSLHFLTKFGRALFQRSRSVAVHGRGRVSAAHSSDRPTCLPVRYNPKGSKSRNSRWSGDFRQVLAHFRLGQKGRSKQPSHPPLSP
jgi:hypothetical protein